MGRFDECIESFYRKYCDAEAKDTMIEYLRNVRRPVKENPNDFADRISTLIRYTNRLPGIEADINEELEKKMIFESFPKNWRIAYIRANRKLANESLSEMLSFMNDEKGFADEADANKRQRNENNNDTRRVRGGGYMAKGRNGNRNGGRQHVHQQGGQNMCRKHNGQHLWICATSSMGHSSGGLGWTLED